MSSPLSLPTSVDGFQAKLIYDFDCLIAVTGALLGLSTVAVALRVYVRAAMTKQFGWDDATMVLAYIFWIVCGALCFVATNAEKALVEGVTTMSLGKLVNLIRYFNAFYALTMIAVKISIGVFFLKLFTASFKWQRILIYTLASISTIFGLGYIVMTFATCGIMVRSQATTQFHTGTQWCAVQDKFVIVSITYSVINAVTDLILQALSIHVLWNAKLNRPTKISAAVLLIFGLIGGVASIMRITVQTPLDQVALEGVLLGLWSNTEAGLSVTAASLITLRPLFQDCLERTKSSLASISGHSRRSGMRSAESTDVEKGRACRKCSNACSECGVKVTKTFEVSEKEVDTLRSSSSSSSGDY